MRHSIQKLAETGKAFGTVLVAGAGRGGHLDVLRALRAQRTVLVEPVPTLARAIQPRPGEEVWTMALTSEQVGETTLHLVSQAQHSSLKQPTALLDYFQRLKPSGEVAVAAQALSDAIDQLALDASVAHLLVLDVPGMVGDLVASVDDSGLGRFSDVLLRGPEEALYDGEVPLAVAIARLQRAGFEQVLDDPGEIYPYRAVLMARAGEVAAAGEQICAEELSARLESVQREYSDFQARADEARGALAYEREAISRTLAETELHCQRQREELEQRASRIADLEREVHRLRDEKHRLESEAVQAGVSTSAELQALQVRLKAQEAANQAYRDEVEALRARVGELNRGVAEAAASAGLSVRLQTLRENDLAELQQRYSALCDAHGRQQELLEKLSTRLMAANEYFQRLARSDDAAGREQAELVAERPAATVRRKKVPSTAVRTPGKDRGPGGRKV